MSRASSNGYASSSHAASASAARTTASVVDRAVAAASSALAGAKSFGVMELEHSIGTSGLPASLYAIPNTTKYVSTAGACIIVGDANDPHAQQFLRGHDDTIQKIVVSEDGRFAVSGQQGVNADVCFWSLEEQHIVHRFREHDRCVLALALSPDSTIVASLGDEKQLVFADTSNGGQITHMSMLQVIPTTDTVCGLYFGPRVQDHKRRNTNLTHVALVTSSQLFLFQLDPYAGQLHQTKVNLTGFQRRFSVGRYTTNGDFFILGTEAGDVAVIDAAHGTIGATSRLCSGGVRDILVSGSLHHNDCIPADQNSAVPAGVPNSFRYAKFGPGSERRTLFFVGGGDGTIASVEIPDHVNPQCRVVAKKTISGSAMSLSIAKQSPAAAAAAGGGGGVGGGSGASTLLVGSASGSLFLVDMTNPAAAFANAYTQVPTTNGVTSVSDSIAAPYTVITPHPSDPERYYTAALDGLIRCWDLSSYRMTQTFEMDTKSVSNLTCSGTAIADGLELQLSSWSDGAIRCHDLTNSKLLWSHARAHRSAVTALAIAPSLKYFVSGSAEGDIRVFDIRSREVKLELKDHNQAITHLQLFDDDRHLLSASKDRSIITWDLTTGRRVTCHEAHDGPLTSALLSRNQSEVYSVGHDHRVKVHDLRFREAARVALYASPHSDAFATKIRRSVDERMLVTAGTDQVVKLWDPRNLSQITTGFGHSGTVTDVGFTCDNRQVLSCGAEGNTMVWNVYA